MLIYNNKITTEMMLETLNNTNLQHGLWQKKPISNCLYLDLNISSTKNNIKEFIFIGSPQQEIQQWTTSNTAQENKISYIQKYITQTHNLLLNDKNTSKELNTIITTAENNGYRRWLQTSRSKQKLKAATGIQTAKMGHRHIHRQLTQNSIQNNKHNQ